MKRNSDPHPPLRVGGVWMMWLLATDCKTRRQNTISESRQKTREADELQKSFRRRKTVPRSPENDQLAALIGRRLINRSAD